MANDIFKNISFSVNYDEHKKRQTVKDYFESIEKKQLTTKELENIVFDIVYNDITKDSKKPKS